MNNTEKVLQKFDNGELINMDSLMAFDEDLTCKRCNAVFSLIEGKWEGKHPKYSGIKAVGIKCPQCERVNVSYYKTGTLIKLENRLRRLYKESHSMKQISKALNKYKREFIRVQETYGEIDVSKKAKNQGSG